MVKEVIICNRRYELINHPQRLELIDKTDRSIKIDLSFTKDAEKNKNAVEALTKFFSMVFR